MALYDLDESCFDEDFDVPTNLSDAQAKEISQPLLLRRFSSSYAALLAADIQPRSGGQWAHTFVHGQFAGQLLRRRKLYASALRETLPRLQKLRHQADYDTYQVTETEATCAVRRSQAFVAAIQEVVVRGGERR